jgi:hypothetical protein
MSYENPATGECQSDAKKVGLHLQLLYDVEAAT